MIKKQILILGLSTIFLVFFFVQYVSAVTVNPKTIFLNSQTNYTSGITFNASSIQVQQSHIYFGSKYYDLIATGGKVAANVTSFYENQNVTVHILNSSLTNVNMTVAGQATRVSIDGTFYNYGTRWYYINGNNSTLINVQSGRTVFVDFVTPTAITSTDPRLESSGEQRASYFDGTNNWIFYYDGSNLVYRYSPNGGLVWSVPASTGSGTLASNSYFGVYGESNKVVVTWASAAGAFTKIGTISGTSIGWNSGVSVPLPPNIGQNYYPSFEKVGSNLFLGANVLANGSSSVALNNVQSTSGTIPSKSHPITLASFNAGTGSNRLLLVGIEANNQYVTSVTFGGVSMTRAVSHFRNNDAEFWYLVNPSGTGDVVVTMNGKTSAVVGAYAFSGVNQTNPIPTTATNFNTASSSPTISITTQYPNSWVLDSPAIYGGQTLGSPTCTQQWDINIPSAITGASSSKTTTSPGTVTCSWTASPSGDLWDDVAVEVRAAGSNSGTVVNSTTLGSSWSSSTTLYSGEIQPAIVGLAKYGSTNLVAVFAKYGSGEFNYATFNGVSWSGISPTSGAGLTTNANKTQAFSITSNGTCAWVGYVADNTGGPLKSMLFCSPTNITFPATGITTTNFQPTISAIGNNIHLFYTRSNEIFRIINSNGTKWGPEDNPFGTITTESFLHAEKYGNSAHHVPIVWKEGTSSPFTVKFGITNIQWELDNQHQVNNPDPFQAKQFESSLSVYPPNQNILIDSFNDLHTSGCQTFRSTDGGNNWSNVTSAIITGNGDPVVTIAKNNTFFYTCLRIGDQTNGDIIMKKSVDSGNTWTNYVNPIVPIIHQGLTDKSWVTADRSNNATTQNHVYVCWTNDTSIGSPNPDIFEIKFKRITPPDSQIQTLATTVGTGQLVQGCNMALDPQGHVFVTWERLINSTTGQIELVRNYNAGISGSWTAVKTVGTFNRFGSNGLGIIGGDQSSSILVTNYPSIAVDSTGAAHIVYATNSPNTLGDIEYVMSNNCKTSNNSTDPCTFSNPITINLDGIISDQFSPILLISNSTNPQILHVMAMDRRDDPNNVFWKPWDYHCHLYTNCTNPVNWYNAKISDSPSTNYDWMNPNGGKIGEYDGLVSTIFREAISSWTDHSQSNPVQDSNIRSDKTRS